MKAIFIEKNCEIKTKPVAFPIRFYAPAWAKGYRCEPGTCGLCCIVQRPEKVSNQFLDVFPKLICGRYDLEKKKCRKHLQRRFGCRVFPLIFGVEEGVIVASTMLGCPATNSNFEVDPRVLERALSDPYILRAIVEMDILYKEAKSNDLWKEAERFWVSLSDKVRSFFDRKKSFPFVSELKDLVFEAADDFLDIPKLKREHDELPSWKKLVFNVARGYIATRFESCRVYYIKVRGQETTMISTDSQLRDRREIKFKTPEGPPELELDDGAHDLFGDYVSLMFKRPFLSLAATCLELSPRHVPMYLSELLVGSLVSLEIGAAVISSRDGLTRVDRDTMREIISFSEPVVLNQFEMLSLRVIPLEYIYKNPVFRGRL
jgi:Fe-S-cluster containining protein